jgi:hypothetical protein
MAQQQNYGVSWKKILVVLAILPFLNGCSLLQWNKPETEVKVVTKVEQTQIPTVPRPKPLQLTDTRVRVVNQHNLEDFIAEFKEQNGELAFVALSMRDYENLALNIADLRRYIKQQGEIIVYYETAVTPKKEEPKQTEEK